MRKLISIVCSAACAAYTSAAATGGAGGSPAGGAHGDSGSHSAKSAGSAINGVREVSVKSSLETRAARLGVVSIDRVTIDAKQKRLATVRVHEPLTEADKDSLLRHGYRKCLEKCVLAQPRQPSEIYCTDAIWAQQRSTSMCIRFEYRGMN
jgi:hypothetical protein